MASELLRMASNFVFVRFRSHCKTEMRSYRDVRIAAPRGIRFYGDINSHMLEDALKAALRDIIIDRTTEDYDDLNDTSTTYRQVEFGIEQVENWIKEEFSGDDRPAEGQFDSYIRFMYVHQVKSLVLDSSNTLLFAPNVISLSYDEVVESGLEEVHSVETYGSVGIDAGQTVIFPIINQYRDATLRRKILPEDEYKNIKKEEERDHVQ